jgi:hypothetical protein
MPELEYTDEPKMLIAVYGRADKPSAEVLTRYNNRLTAILRVLSLIAVEK